MGRRAVEVEPVLLDVLAVIALAVGKAEHPLFEDRVRTVPDGQGQAQALALVADAGNPVFAPLVGARARLVVGERIPRVAPATLVLADRAPLALAQVRPPRLPGRLAGVGLLQAPMLGGRVGRRAGRHVRRSIVDEPRSGQCRRMHACHRCVSAPARGPRILAVARLRRQGRRGVPGMPPASARTPWR